MFNLRWGTDATGDSAFLRPSGLALDTANNVLVLDSVKNQVMKFDASGTLLAKWGSSGLGNGQFRSPSSIAVDRNGSVYVADTGNNRIQKFAADGTFV
ncbi:MAG: 6-bladed beta-propeller, partial [Chloroflexi bacterium]|nr:6-bladed beta-propeller [Chloroflexota bacterium]